MSINFNIHIIKSANKLKINNTDGILKLLSLELTLQWLYLYDNVLNKIWYTILLCITSKGYIKYIIMFDFIVTYNFLNTNIQVVHVLTCETMSSRKRDSTKFYTKKIKLSYFFILSNLLFIKKHIFIFFALP